MEAVWFSWTQAAPLQALCSTQGDTVVSCALHECFPAVDCWHTTDLHSSTRHFQLQLCNTLGVVFSALQALYDTLGMVSFALQAHAIP